MTRCPAGVMQERYIYLHNTVFCSRLFIALYKAESVPESGGAARAAAAACCLVANIPAFMGHGTWDMYGTIWDMGHRPHSSIISLCRVELSGAGSIVR